MLNKLLFNKAVQLLSRKDYTEYELRQKLTQFCILYQQKKQNKTHKVESVNKPDNISALTHLLDETIDKIRYYNWLDDEAYAGRYVKKYLEKGYGLNKIVNDLKAKGITQQHIHLALATNNTDSSIPLANIINKKFKGADFKDWKTKNRIKRYLYSRGFGVDDIQAFFKDENFYN